MKKSVNWKVLIYSILIVYGIAFLGSIFTSSSTNSEWYFNNKPSITPPNYVFPIVWNILFFLIALSLYFSWTAGKSNKQKTKIAWIFGINLFLNTLWSYLFFYLQNPVFAFFDLILIWITIIMMIFTTYNINKKSAWLLVPYLLWVSFAGYLNWLWIFP